MLFLVEYVGGVVYVRGCGVHGLPYVGGCGVAFKLCVRGVVYIMVCSLCRGSVEVCLCQRMLFMSWVCCLCQRMLLMSGVLFMLGCCLLVCSDFYTFKTRLIQ